MVNNCLGGVAMASSERVGDRNKLHCLVNGDLLDYDVSQKVVDCLHTLMQVYPHTESKCCSTICVSAGCFRLF